MKSRIEEKKMTPAQMKKREEIVLSMKKNKTDMKKRYGDRWEEVMYATATKQAMAEKAKPDFLDKEPMKKADADKAKAVIKEGVLDDTDDDGWMAKSQLYKLAKYAIALHKMIDDGDSLEPWVQAKITRASEDISAVKHYMEYSTKSENGEHDDELEAIKRKLDVGLGEDAGSKFSPEIRAMMKQYGVDPGVDEDMLFKPEDKSKPEPATELPEEGMLNESENEYSILTIRSKDGSDQYIGYVYDNMGSFVYKTDPVDSKDHAIAMVRRLYPYATPNNVEYSSSSMMESRYVVKKENDRYSVYEKTKSLKESKVRMKAVRKGLPLWEAKFVSALLESKTLKKRMR